MKKLLLLFVFAAIMSVLSVAQIPKYDTGRVEVNSVTAMFISDGTLNYKSNQLPGYLVPKGNGIGPKTLNSNTMKSLDVALVFAMPPVGGVGYAYSVAMLPKYISEVKGFYDSQNYNCDESLLLGVNEVKTAIAPDMLVYPNPAKDELYVQFSNANNGKINITLYNILGEQVISRVAESQSTFSIPVANLSPGLYMLRAQMEDGSILTKKIEVTR